MGDIVSKVSIKTIALNTIRKKLIGKVIPK